jgi:hypothetical protein
MTRTSLAALGTAATVLCCSSMTSTPAGIPEADSGVRGGGCPAFGTPSPLGALEAAPIDESSGLAASSLNAGVYWVHNDSGDVARAFATSSEGKLLMTLNFDESMPLDIEDMAIEDDPMDGSFLYFGDIGDNDLVRTQLTIHRAREPKIGPATLTTPSEKMTVMYPDGAHNAETLLFDPITKDLLIATKVPGGPSAIHRVGPFAAGTTITTEKIAEVAVERATGGDISRDGRFIGIRNYSPNAFVWVRARGESLAAALARPPCSAPVANELQGEALAFQVGNTGFVTISEGKNPELHVTPIE